jgi:hypothetical protein|eukprot:CAMPEP_0174281584 /NCGR_PEP_ID=MMETSP0809-20121228/1960_1 /TAXON_ID=73025 ORGANISM="Eutreptiella gymnastica-like, Strain CCMP1594" /NCGR_SAMPLE_ID=MMETSP0809 /ASSEMBLY_ACC=CAM_ASM_000658 /LENGTH=104 /DNA_ID=CAMNT_0015375217 /DNA_START=979 /DNA_END=1293 /DNA_ORIENTATION=+
MIRGTAREATFTTLAAAATATATVAATAATITATAEAAATVAAATVAAAASLTCLSCLVAVLAAGRLVLKSFLSKELLLASGEHEAFTTIAAGQGDVSEPRHWK